uniref:Pentatricopeptide repeat-containing protein At1g62680, mitochondrial-like n=1 Tax=Cicer arietinum TaxID=3827 RepID=A0A1S3DXW2_CICAR|nr:pentatricopeptide repeat-containing protein At1g62680, mitochondrial-like [Cicer arietinum]
MLLSPSVSVSKLLTLTRYAFSLSSIPNFLPISSSNTFLLSFSSHSPFNSNEFDVNHAVSSFHRMLSMNPTPSIVQFNIILTSFVKMNHYPTAISLSHHLEFNGIKPDIVTFNILINCYCHLGQMNFSFSILGKILKMGFQENTITLTTLMKGLCLNNNVREALHFHDHVVAKGFQLDQHIITLVNFRVDGKWCIFLCEDRGRVTSQVK